MKKKSISELIHFFVRHPLQNSLQMKFWRWLVSPADAEDKEEAIQGGVKEMERRAIAGRVDEYHR